MTQIAIYSGPIVIYWSSLVICLGLVSALALALSLYSASSGRAAAMLLLLPLAVLFSVPLCRAIHWYCHTEQYNGLLGALTDYSSGSYCLPGALLGTWLAAVIVAKLRFAESAAKLLDAFAPSAALAIAFIRLSALFNSSCRSKISVKTDFLQRLPIASGVTDPSTGAVDYRFATFFVQFILMVILTVWLVRFFCKRRRIAMKSGSTDGNVARMFLLYYSAIEVVMDSTRYDSSFLRFNSFVSLVQIVGAVCILALLIYYSIHSVRANRLKLYHYALWIAFLVVLGIAGGSEYMVQRHGDWYLGCYAVMSLSCYLMVKIVYRLYLSCCAKRKVSTE